jgi:hypothetical protein
VRRFLGTLLAVGILFVVVGWFRDWYTVSNKPADPGHSAFHVDVDRDKVTNDFVGAGLWLRGLVVKTPREPAEQPPSE